MQRLPSMNEAQGHTKRRKKMTESRKSILGRQKSSKQTVPQQSKHSNSEIKPNDVIARLFLPGKYTALERLLASTKRSNSSMQSPLSIASTEENKYGQVRVKLQPLYFHPVPKCLLSKTIWLVICKVHPLSQFPFLILYNSQKEKQCLHLFVFVVVLLSKVQHSLACGVWKQILTVDKEERRVGRRGGEIYCQETDYRKVTSTLDKLLSKS